MRRLRSLLATALVVVLAACAQQAAPTAIPPEAVPSAEPALGRSDAPTELFFSEYIEGSSNNKAFEIFNGTGAAVDLAGGGYNVQMFFNGSAAAGLTINLVGTVADGDVFVLAQSSAVATVLAQADQTNGAGWFNGDDAVVLRRGTTVLDVIGQVGFDPGTQWGADLVSTADNTLRRVASVCASDPVGGDAFDPAVGWAGFANDTFDGLGVHVATCDGGPAASDPRLNEFSASTASTDVEYLEVFGSVSSDYAAYTVLQIEGDVGTSSGIVDGAYSVGTTDAAGLWLVDLAPNALENGTITLLLVEGFTGTIGTDLDTDDDGVLDAAPWTRIVDAIGVHDGGAGDLTYVADVGVALGVAFDGLPFAPGGASRVPDGTGEWVRNDFDLAGIPGFSGTPVDGEALNTPGAPNAVVDVTPPGPCTTSPLPIPCIQGSGATAAITGQVTVRGVVVGDFEGPGPALRGFYLQDPTGDGDDATSDGIFVFDGSNGDRVAVGDLVEVSGIAAEFQGQTQISASSVDVLGTGTVGPVDVTLPVPDATYLERFEGMLVRLPQTLYVTEHFQLGRFGQVVLSADGRLVQPTQVERPGPAAEALQAANALHRIILDDALQDQNPDPIVFARGGQPLSATNTLRGGDTATGIVGVLTYTWAGNGASPNAYRVRPLGALGGSVQFDAANPRPTASPDVGGGLRVGALNVLNYFDSIDACTAGVGGAPVDCRGAGDAIELERQAAKIVATITGLDAAVLGLVEIENDGYGTDSALQDLVDRLNAATAPGTWAFVDVDAGTGEVNALGTDAIKVALIYQPARVTPVGTTAALNTPAFETGGDFDPRNRPALAQAFAEPATGGVFVAVVNHLKSKGSACNAPDAGDGQGNCNEVRTRAAEELAAWLATDPTDAGDPDVLILGDLNAYAMEDPIAALEGAGYVNLQAAFGGYGAYTYVFDGQWGSLDHALASATLAGQADGAAAWAINADEPSVLDYNVDFKSVGQIASLYAPDAFRSSDHDPLIVGLTLNATPDCSAAAPSRATLWPPRHQYVSVSIGGVTDDDDVQVAVTAVFQDEPVDAPGGADGATAPDAAIGLGGAVDLRAERDETGNGRVYHVSFVATDPLGQSCTGTVQVAVPRSQGRTGAAVDDGPLFDATAP
jgi:predicted extracellular nuclease